MAGYKARNCSGYPMSTGQSLKSPAAQPPVAHKRCPNRDVCSVVRIALLVYALVALVIYFSL